MNEKTEYPIGERRIKKANKGLSLGIGIPMTIVAIIVLPFVIHQKLIGPQEIVIPPPPTPGDLTEGYEAFALRSPDWYQVNDAPRFFDNSHEAIFIDGSTATVPITVEIIRQQESLAHDFSRYTPQMLEDYDEQINLNVSLNHHFKTHQSYLHLIDGTCNAPDDHVHTNDQGFDKAPLRRNNRVSLVFATEPSDEELAYAASKGVTLEIDAICNEAFVFIVNGDNPVDSLTIEQIQDIYQGNITNWSEVGGEDKEIVPFQRNKNSGSQTAMENIVMQGKPILKPVMTERIYTMSYGMGALVEQIVELPEEFKDTASSIGYTYDYYINNIYSERNIKVIKINGIAPNELTVKDKTYPFGTSYYAVMRADENEHPLSNNIARPLRDFLLTPKGQEYIKLAGYYPL